MVTRAWGHLSNGAGFEYKSSFDTFAGFWDSQHLLTGNFDGDGKDDLVNVYGSNPDYRHLNLAQGPN
ncbi:MAG: hypothetical protein AAFW84_04030 [Cyanobacteria bacterium J06635_15]